MAVQPPKCPPDQVDVVGPRVPWFVAISIAALIVAGIALLKVVELESGRTLTRDD